MQGKPRAGLNKREAPGKIVTVRPPKRVVFHMRPRFNFAKAPVKNVETDTTWQPTFRRQLGVTMHGGSYVVINLFKQTVVSQKKDPFATVTLHNNLFCHRRSDYLHYTNGRLRNLLADCFTVGLYYATITRQ